MKKIITVFLLSLVLVSCGKKDEDISVKDHKIVAEKEIEKVEEKGELREKQNLGEKQGVKQDLKEDVTVKEKNDLKKLEERKEILDKSISHYKTLNTASKANLNCEELSPVQNGMTMEEKKLAMITTSKCNKIRSQAREDLVSEKKGFKISDCKSFIEQREKQFEEINKNQKLPEGVVLPSKEDRSKFVKQEIETCEIGYALKKNDCNVLNDVEKKQKCEKFKTLRDEKFELERLEKFRIEDYLR